MNRLVVPADALEQQQRVAPALQHDPDRECELERRRKLKPAKKQHRHQRRCQNDVPTKSPAAPAYTAQTSVTAEKQVAG